MTRLRLLLVLNICAVLLLIAVGAWTSYAHTIRRIEPEHAQLQDPPMVDYCRKIQGALADRRFDHLDAEAADLAGLQERFHGGIEKLVVFYNALANLGCDGFDCRVDYQPRLKPLQDWLDQNPHGPAAWIANAWFWEDYAWNARRCAEFKDVTFDQWQAFYDRSRKAGSYLAHDGLRLDPAYFLLSLDVLRDTGGTRGQIDAMFQEGHAAFPRFLRLDAEYALLLDPTWYGKEGDLGRFAETLLNDPGGEDGQIAYAVVAQEEAEHIPYPHLFLETGLTWAKTKPGLALMVQKYGASNRDWNRICYMAMIAIDRPAALDAYQQFAPLWNSAIWFNADYFYDQALPWILFKK
jgi:Domain of unknown function (DUF4034)